MNKYEKYKLKKGMAEIQDKHAARKMIPEKYGTIQLPIANSKSICDKNNIGTIMLFGSWIESGNEDEELKELYQSRLVQSGDDVTII